LGVVSLLPQLFHYKITNSLIKWFTINHEFAYLQDENNKDYEIPVVSFVAKTYSKLEYTFVFGNQIFDLKNKGNYYFFTDYEKAKQECNLFSSEEKKGIIRFALFLGKLQIVESWEEFKKEKENLLFFNTIQINFPNFNSFYLIKKKDQQIPLSYQIISE
jgi:hypothetical protein